MIQIRTTLAAAAILSGIAATAGAFPSYFSQFQEEYPSTTLSGSFVCNICHMAGGGNGWNPYARDIIENGEFDPIPFSQFEALDSDGDGVSNIAEINANTHPGRADGMTTSVFLTGAISLPRPYKSRDISGFVEGAAGDVNKDDIADAADIVEAMKTTDTFRMEVLLGTTEQEPEMEFSVAELEALLTGGNWKDQTAPGAGEVWPMMCLMPFEGASALAHTLGD